LENDFCHRKPNEGKLKKISRKIRKK